MGHPVAICDGVTIAHPPLGVWSLLEMIDSRYIKCSEQCDPLDALRALYICSVGRDALPAVVAYIPHRDNPVALSDTGHYTAFDWTVARWAQLAIGTRPLDLTAFDAALDLAFSGFSMIPAGGPGSAYIFGTPTIASTMLILGPLGYSQDDILWSVPSCLVGHIIAAHAKLNGVKGVSRPKDRRDIATQLKLAEAREDSGELHPWQITSPELHRITNRQREANPSIIDLYNCIVKCKLAEGEHGTD